MLTPLLEIKNHRSEGMTVRNILKNAVLASALAMPACHTPVKPNELLGKPPIVEQTSQRYRHPCENEVIPGGMKTHSYILLQIHEEKVGHIAELKKIIGEVSGDPTRTMTDGAALSQILQFRIINDLIKNYGIKTVILEGMPKKPLKLLSKKEMDSTQREFFEMLVSISEKCIPEAMRTHPDLSEKHAAEDFCLALYIFQDPLSNYILLATSNPVIAFTGFEREDFRERIKKAFDPSDPNYESAKKIIERYERTGRDPKILEDAVKNDPMRFLVEGRSTDAVREVISHSSQNAALVIGEGHRDSMKETINKIPPTERPTFHFIPPTCQNREAFFVSPEAIMLAREHAKSLENNSPK